MAHAIFIGVCKAFDIEMREQQEKEQEPVSVYYTVVQGDTLWAISKRFGVTLKDIVSLTEPKKNAIIKSS